MNKLVLSVVLLSLGTLGWAQDKDTKNAEKHMDELQRATEVMQQITSAPDSGVPDTVVQGAKCVAVIPKLVKGAFVVGGEHGRGVATCRTTNGWSAAAPFAVSGISLGPQIGGKSTDLVMFVMNEQGMNQLMSGHFKVGGDLSAAAGPVGRQASAEAGWKAAILTYSSSKGAFIGASINGATLSQDDHATREWYGRDVPIKDLLSGSVQATNPQVRAFVDAVANAKSINAGK